VQCNKSSAINGASFHKPSGKVFPLGKLRDLTNGAITMSFNYVIFQDVSPVTGNQSLDSAIEMAEGFLADVPKEVLTTFSVEDECGHTLANVTNRRIQGEFTKQRWGGRKGDDAITLGETSFDATDYVLLMKHEDLILLADNSDSTDVLGQAHIDWDGPHYVRIVESICAFFDVSDVKNISFASFMYARKRANPQVPKVEIVNLYLKVQLRVCLELIQEILPTILVIRLPQILVG
jgi:hypothetical protein